MARWPTCATLHTGRARDALIKQPELGTSGIHARPGLRAAPRPQPGQIRQICATNRWARVMAPWPYMREPRPTSATSRWARATAPWPICANPAYPALPVDGHGRRLHGLYARTPGLPALLPVDGHGADGLHGLYARPGLPALPVDGHGRRFHGLHARTRPTSAYQSMGTGDGSMAYMREPRPTSATNRWARVMAPWPICATPAYQRYQSMGNGRRLHGLYAATPAYQRYQSMGHGRRLHGPICRDPGLPSATSRWARGDGSMAYIAPTPAYQRYQFDGATGDGSMAYMRDPGLPALPVDGHGRRFHGLHARPRPTMSRPTCALQSNPGYMRDPGLRATPPMSTSNNPEFVQYWLKKSFDEKLDRDRREIAIQQTGGADGCRPPLLQLI